MMCVAVCCLIVGVVCRLLLFLVCCSLFGVRCLLYVVVSVGWCFLLLVVCGLLCDVGCVLLLLFVVCCCFVVCRLSFVDGCLWLSGVVDCC